MDFPIINVEPSKGREISKLVLRNIAVKSIVGVTNDDNIFLPNFYKYYKYSISYHYGNHLLRNFLTRLQDA
jgi:hypothetical protein